VSGRWGREVSELLSISQLLFSVEAQKHHLLHCDMWVYIILFSAILFSKEILAFYENISPSNLAHCAKMEILQ
jgi:hypothetical protein